MWKFYKIFVHLKKILEFFFSNLKSLLLGRFLRFGGLVFANIPNLRFLTNFLGAKKRVPPKMSNFFCLSLLLMHWIEFAYYWQSGNSCKLSSRGKFRILQCPQNNMIRDKGQRETCVLTLCHPGFWILVISWGGGPQDPQLYFAIFGLFYAP